MILAALALAMAAPACASDQSPQALLCRAVAAGDDKRFAEAAAGFEAAAGASPLAQEKTLRMWAAAGNMWIAASQPGRAAAALDRALGQPGLDPAQTGLAELDRARAAEQQDDLKTARSFADRALAKLGDDPFAHYFSAALAVREGDLVRARAAIDRALAKAPDDPQVLFEAGHVAEAEGNRERARAAWAKAAELDPGGEVGKAAVKALAMLPVPVTVR